MKRSEGILPIMHESDRPPLWKRITALFAAILGQSAGRGAPAASNDTPEGLVYLYSESSAAEAALTRQLLNQQGFHVEYVPEKWNGMYGLTGSPDIYVRPDEVQPILGFLKELRFPEDGSP